MSTLSTIHQTIKQELRQIERHEGVRILYACESAAGRGGSRRRTVIMMSASSMCRPWTGTCRSGTAETSSSARLAISST